MKLDSLQALYIEHLQDIYDAENQITKALPKMAQAASSPQLQQAFQQHLEQTREHISRLEQIFQGLGANPQGKTCKGMQGLIKEGEELMKEKPTPDVLDAGLISAAQKVEHYEIAAYGTVRTYAQQLGHQNAVNVLQRTLDEEGNTDKKLTRLAEQGINAQAKV